MSNPTFRQIAENIVYGRTEAYSPHEGIIAALLDVADAIRENNTTAVIQDENKTLNHLLAILIANLRSPSATDAEDIRP